MLELPKMEQLITKEKWFESLTAKEKAEELWNLDE